MKTVIRGSWFSAVVVTAIALVPSAAFATPSTTFWAPSTASCQPAGVPHITYDTYYGKGTPPPGAGAPAYPIDTGLTIGVIPSTKVQAEIGYDLLLPSSDPIFLFLNAKVCVPENVMGKGAPALSAGFWNVGFKKGFTDFNIAYANVQKTFPFGYIDVGVYHGLSDVLFTNSDGKIVKTGLLAGWTSPDINVGLKGLKKLNVAADVQTGKNALGAGGGGLYFYFNDYIDLLVGPVFYTDKKLQPGGKKMLWTTQLDVDIPLGKSK